MNFMGASYRRWQLSHSKLGAKDVRLTFYLLGRIHLSIAIILYLHYDQYQRYHHQKLSLISIPSLSVAIPRRRIPHTRALPLGSSDLGFSPSRIDLPSHRGPCGVVDVVSCQEGVSGKHESGSNRFCVRWCSFVRLGSKSRYGFIIGFSRVWMECFVGLVIWHKVKMDMDAREKLRGISLIKLVNCQ